MLAEKLLQFSWTLLHVLQISLHCDSAIELSLLRQQHGHAFAQ
jgi:hypothetical protein